MLDPKRFALICMLTAAGQATSVHAAALTDTEPNNTCASAQGAGVLAASASASVSGALVTPPTTPDIDFYKFTGVPGGMARITMKGSGDGTHTLVDPIVGVLDSSCNFITYPWLPNPGSMTIDLPADGVFVIGVSSYGDFQFDGAGASAGTYSLDVADVEPVRSISGRVVADGSQTGLENISVELFYCVDAACDFPEFVAQGFTDYAGQYRWDQVFGRRLIPGNYRINAYDFNGNYASTQSPAFAALGGKDRVVADIGMKPTPVIGSLSGRILDAVTRAPLAGSGPPNARVTIYGCVDYACSSASGVVDSAGHFRIERGDDGRGVIAGALYTVIVSADQYQEITMYTQAVEEGMHLDLGDIKIQSNPVRFRVLKGCGNIPLSGGTCRYDVEITNGLPNRVKGVAWATIDSNGLTGFVGRSSFQAGAPREMQLAPAIRTKRSTRLASFEFDIPASVPTYALICPTFWFGSDPANAQLLPQGALMDHEWCVQRTVTGYKPLTPQQARSLRKAAREHDVKRRSLMLPRR